MGKTLLILKEQTGLEKRAITQGQPAGKWVGLSGIHIYVTPEILVTTLGINVTDSEKQGGGRSYSEKRGGMQLDRWEGGKSERERERMHTPGVGCEEGLADRWRRP